MALTDNITAYYKFDENTGSTVADNINSNNGTFNGTGTKWATGKINSGGLMNGTDNNVQVVSNSSIQGLAAVTISTWWKADVGSGSAYRKIFYKNGVYDVGLTQDFGGGAHPFAEIVGVYNFGILNSGSYADGNWHSIILTYDGSTAIAYLDGSVAVTHAATGSTASNANDLFFGYNSGNGSEFFKGVLDEVGIWSRALSSTEVAQLYNSGAALPYPFNGFTDSGANFLSPHHLIVGDGMSRSEVAN